MEPLKKTPNELLALPLKLANAAVGEIKAWFSFFIISWPNSPFGYRLRRMYWRKKTGIKKIIVGRNSTLGDCSCFIFGDNLDIGDNVEFVADGVDGYKVFMGSNISVARGVYLRSANHRWNDTDNLIMGQGHASKKVNHKGVDYSIVIDSDTWIGANVIILSGAMIGEGSVIGAGSVVTDIIPPYSIAAGSPARVISKRK